ncbi:MAG: hypothetical protein AAGI30_14515 [Planctomycetota bacterium]
MHVPNIVSILPVALVTLTAPVFGQVGLTGPVPDVGRSARATYLVTEQSFTPESEILWDGFLTGLEGFEHFYEPIGSPYYFEDPFIDTEIKFVYIHHQFPNNGITNGGELDVAALQIRVALTDRLAFIATQDGYAWLDLNENAPEQEGWVDVAAGFKYAAVIDHENDFLLTFGLRYKFDSGSDDVLQSGVQELSPFLTFAKGWDRLHLIGSLTYRVPLDSNDGNEILQWHTHVDYEVVDGIAPFLEFHGIHYTDDAERTPLPIGGVDYSNFGSTDVEGTDVVFMGVGASFKISPNLEVGAAYEFSLTNPEVDLFEDRVTVGATLRW